MHWAKGVTWEAYVLSTSSTLPRSTGRTSRSWRNTVIMVLPRSTWTQTRLRPGLHEPANLTDHDTGVVVYLSSQNLTDHWRRRVLIEPIPTQIIALCASSERGGLGERKREIDRRARQQASAHSSPDSHPEGQYRTTLHRGPAPCVFLRLDALAADSPRRRRQ